MAAAPDRSFVSEYFANLNEISKKIALDIEEIRSAYEHIWDDLSREEQMEIVNETIIKPELALKYFDNFSTSTDSLQRILGTDDDENGTGEDDRNANLYDGKGLQTFQYVRTGRKVVTDDSIGLFRDEHSAPFSHKTKSQINLTIFPLEKDAKSDRAAGSAKGGALLAKKLLLKSPKLDDSVCDGKETGGKANKEQKDKVGPPVGAQAIYDSERNIISNEATTKGLGSGPGAGLFSKFNTLIFNQPPLEMTSAASAASIDGSDEVDGTIDQDEFDTDNDKVNLFTKSSKNECLHRAQSSSVEEDDKNYDELNSLLGNSKGFDFLNNW